MSLVDVIERALRERRVFDVQKEKTDRCATFDNLLTYCPELFAKVDSHLFDGALAEFMRKSNIHFEVVASTSGPAGLTTYSPSSKKNVMSIALRRDAWQTSFPALVGGNLCHAADNCLIDVFLHEMVHVLCFCLYTQINITPEDVKQSIPFFYDPTHNVLFTVWLAAFFNQSTINNSLLLCGTDVPLTFARNMRETEEACIVHPKQGAQLQMMRNGQKEPVTLINSNTSTQSVPNLKPHHSHVRTLDGTLLAVPNGLLFC